MEHGEGEGANTIRRLHERAIIKTLASWYVGSYFRPGVYFDPNGPRLKGMLQRRGFCLQARKLPAVTIFIDFVTADNAITHVKHASGLPCEK